VGFFFGMYVLPMLGVTVARKARREGKRFQNEVYVLLMRGLPSLAPRSFAHVPVRCFRLSCPLPCSRPAGWPLWTESRSYFVAILEPLFFLTAIQTLPIKRFVSEAFLSSHLLAALGSISVVVGLSVPDTAGVERGEADGTSRISVLAKTASVPLIVAICLPRQRSRDT